MRQKSTRTKPKAEITPEEKVALQGFLKKTKSLSTPRGDDIGVVLDVDLSARYMQLLQEIKAYGGPFDVGVANRVHTSVFKSLPKPPKRMRSHVSLTRESVGLAVEVLGELVCRCAQRSNDGRGLEALVKRCASTLADFAVASQDGFSWAQLAEFFQTAASSAKVRVESLVSEENLGSTFTKLKAGLTKGLLNLLQSGDVPAARQVLAVCGHHSELDEACRAALQKAISENASSLPRESQQVVMRFLNIQIDSGQIDYANPAESPEVRQAAALLLYLYDVRCQTPELEEAFDRYRAVAENQSSLHLRGEVGSAMPFDSRFHEQPESGDPSGEVTVLRPWVEWYRPPEARVVIRGIVEGKAPFGGNGK